MSHLECPQCGEKVADDGPFNVPRWCPNCLVRTGAIVHMVPESVDRPEDAAPLPHAAA
jgi:hypothetical protein